MKVEELYAYVRQNMAGAGQYSSMSGHSFFLNATCLPLFKSLLYIENFFHRQHSYSMRRSDENLGFLISAFSPRVHVQSRICIH